jgi:hypothetical protein
MAIWSGLVDGDWENTANWIGGAVPVDNEDVIFPPDSRVTNPPTTNLDRTGDTAGAGLHLDTIIKSNGANYDIGTSTVPLKCTVDQYIHIIGGGKFFYSSETGSGSHATGDLIVDSSNMQGALVLSGDTDIDRLTLLAGFSSVTMTDGTIGSLVLSLGDRLLPPVVSLVSGAISRRVQFAGLVNSSIGTDSDTIHDLFAGQYMQLATMNGVSPVPEVRVHGGLFDYRGGAPIVGTSLTINAYGGTVDLRTPNASDGLLHVGILNIYPRANILRGPSLVVDSQNFFGNSGI